MRTGLLRHLDFRGGVFVEAGANDALYPEQFLLAGILSGLAWDLWWSRSQRSAAECRRNRPRAMVVNAALVADDDHGRIMVTAAGLRGLRQQVFRGS